MKSLWPRTEPLLAEANEPPLTARRPARPVVIARRTGTSPVGCLPATARLALAVALLAGRLCACGRRRDGYERNRSGDRHVPKFCQIVPGAGCAQTHSTLRPPLCSQEAASAVGRRRAVPARVQEERFYVRRERSGGPPGLRGAGCFGAAGAGRGRAGPDRGRRGRCCRSQASAPRFAGRPQSASPLISQSFVI
jgi:hypothetical protein